MKTRNQDKSILCAICGFPHGLHKAWGENCPNKLKFRHEDPDFKWLETTYHETWTKVYSHIGDTK